MPDNYVSTDCRSGDHRSCQEHPVLRCACECHEGRRPWVERRTETEGNGATSA